MLLSLAYYAMAKMSSRTNKATSVYATTSAVLFYFRLILPIGCLLARAVPLCVKDSAIEVSVDDPQDQEYSGQGASNRFRDNERDFPGAFDVLSPPEWNLLRAAVPGCLLRLW